MSVKSKLISVLKRVTISLVPTCVSAVLATHWELMKPPAMVGPS